MCFFFCMVTTYGQEPIVFSPNNNVGESIFIHHNTSAFFAGEYVYYSVYVVKAGSNTLSTFSKIGYVELVGKDKQVVFRHKIKLAQGKGQGEFFIPATVSSGSYKLIGYTQWMKNRGKDHFFQSDIAIINPFQSDQSAILSPVADSVTSNRNETQGIKALENRIPLGLTLNKKVFEKRDQGQLTISALKNDGAFGDYSISIRKLDTLVASQMPTAQEYLGANGMYRPEEKENNEPPKYLPELRGELVSGRIVSKNPDVPLTEETVALSIPGKQFVLKLARVNAEGIFYFNLDQEYQNNQVLIQILGKNKDNYEIQPLGESTIDYEDLVFKTFTIDSKLKSLILERSVYNQVENAFSELKLDTIVRNESTVPVYRRFPQKYNLDDYTRFPTIRETVSEIVEHVWVQKEAGGQEVLQVRKEDYTTKSNRAPLVIVDGILIQEHGDVIDFNARNVKTINVSRKECVVNSIIYNGIIALETINGDFLDTYTKDYVSAVELVPPMPAKVYFAPKYAGSNKYTTDQIPDFRQQLYWLPHLKLDREETQIDFYTSDVEGTYEIHLEGFTRKGKPVSIKETFEVN